MSVSTASLNIHIENGSSHCILQTYATLDYNCFLYATNIKIYCAIDFASSLYLVYFQNY
jgi:hypothetical protein